MNLKKMLPLLPLFGVLSLASCIRDEAPSVECDITGVDREWLNSLPEGFLLGDPVIRHTPPATVTFRVSAIDPDVPLLIYPKFSVSDGATLFYRTDSVKEVNGRRGFDFRYAQSFGVKSEDGTFFKTYNVTFTIPPAFESCGFEQTSWDNDNHNYQTLLQEGPDGSTYTQFWDSGNAGYKLTGMGRSPEDYPTSFPIDPETGSRVAKLVTRDTGNFGIMTRPKMPIAAGNLFIGTFNVNKAMRFPREATQFGLPIVNREPLTLSGRYKYTAGAEMLDKDKKPLPEKHDTADIYAVLYEVDPENVVPLNGDDVLSSERIVLMARIDNPGEPQEWTDFSENFRPMNGKTVDPYRLSHNGYALAVVMTSSRQGAYFEGAIGSTLYVDDLRIVWK